MFLKKHIVQFYWKHFRKPWLVNSLLSFAQTQIKLYHANQNLTTSRNTSRLMFLMLPKTKGGNTAYHNTVCFKLSWAQTTGVSLWDLVVTDAGSRLSGNLRGLQISPLSPTQSARLWSQSDIVSNCVITTSDDDQRSKRNLSTSLHGGSSGCKRVDIFVTTPAT